MFVLNNPVSVFMGIFLMTLGGFGGLGRVGIGDLGIVEIGVLSYKGTGIFFDIDSLELGGISGKSWV